MTPGYRQDHPRFAVVRRLFDVRGECRPLACAVATKAGFDAQNLALSEEQRSLLKGFLEANLPRSGLSSIALTPRAWGQCPSVDGFAVNYLALPPSEGRVSMAFYAAQGSPDSLSPAMGMVLFGEKTDGLRERVSEEWSENAERLGTRSILRLLGQS